MLCPQHHQRNRMACKWFCCRSNSSYIGARMMKSTKNAHQHYICLRSLSGGSILESGYLFIFSLCLRDGVLILASFKPQVSSIILSSSKKMFLTEDGSIHEANFVRFLALGNFHFLELGSHRKITIPINWNNTVCIRGRHNWVSFSKHTITHKKK